MQVEIIDDPVAERALYEGGSALEELAERIRRQLVGVADATLEVRLLRWNPDDLRKRLEVR